MGCICANSKTTKELIQSLKMVPFQYETIGILKVNIINVTENQNKNKQRFFSTQQNLLQFHLCNQKFSTSLTHQSLIKQTFVPQKHSFQFFINQVNTQKCLQIKLLTKSKQSSQIKTAQGRQVLKDLFFLPKSDKSFQKLSINIPLASEDDIKVGWVRLELQFKPSPYKILLIRVHSVILRNQTKRGRGVYINIKIGGQQFESETKISSQKSIPYFQNASHFFIIPEFLTFGELLVYAKDEQKGFDYLVGELRFDLKAMLQSDDLQSFTEPLNIKDKIAGVVQIQSYRTQGVIPEQMLNMKHPKRIKYVQPKQQQQSNREAVVNYVKKNESQTTNATEKSNALQIENSLPKKLQKLNSSQKKNINIKENNKNENDQQDNLGCNGLKNNQKENTQLPIILKHSQTQKISSESQLNLQKVQIPSTSSLLIQKQSDSITKNQQKLIPNNFEKRSNTNESRKNSANNKKKQSSLIMLPNFKKCDKKAKLKIVNFEENKNKINQNQEKDEFNKRADPKSSFMFEHLPSVLISKSLCLINSSSILSSYSQNKSQIFSMSLKQNSNSDQKNDQSQKAIKQISDLRKIKQIKNIGNKFNNTDKDYQILMKQNYHIKNIVNQSHECNDQPGQQNQSCGEYNLVDYFNGFEIRTNSNIIKKRIRPNS